MWKAIWKVLCSHSFVGGMMLVLGLVDLARGGYGWAAFAFFMCALNFAFAIAEDRQP